MHHSIHFATRRAQELVDITERVRAIVKDSGVQNGLLNVYAQGATAAVMIQENWDESCLLYTSRLPSGLTCWARA